MPRYIDAAKAVERIRKQQPESIARECAVNAVNNTPAADVAPVIYAHKILRYYDMETGHYISKDDIPRFSNHCIRVTPFCGRCGTQIGRGWNFCANCGAVIDTQETHKED